MNMFDRLTETAIADTDLLTKSDQRGDIFTTPRTVDFAFNTDDEQKANDFAKFVNEKCYGRTEIASVDANGFSILVFIDMPITQNPILSVSGFMLCLSHLFAIDYDGWGSVLQESTK